VNNIFNKLKPIFLLLSMSLVCVGMIFVVKQFKKEPEETVISNKEDLIVQNVNEELNLNKLEPEEVTEVQDVAQTAPSNDDSSVLGDSVSCGDAVYIQSNSICTRSGSGNIDYESEGSTRIGTLVSKTAKITLISATVPLELFSGMEVADSNRKITSETPTFKAAGEQIDDISANVQLPPREQIDTYKESSEYEDKPFATDYSIERPETSEVSTTGKIGVNTKYENQCDGQEYNNKSNVTPTKSNGRAELMVGEYRYPNEKVSLEAEDIQPCDQTKDKFIDWDAGQQACQADVVTKVITFFKNIFDTKWNNCLLDKESCIYAEDIVLVMASPFGSTKDCYENGVCTNAYMEKRNSVMKSPSVKSSGKTYYLTDCVVNIEGLGRADVKCAWDMTHLYKELEVNKYDDAPNVESTPSPAAYDNFLQKEIKGKRSGNEMPL
jgi:hypothetical protein